MKQKIRQLKLTMNVKRMTGVMLLEVVLAIAVFAFGMLALVQLQGTLTRSSADANTRTVATNIAEEIIENIRGYEHVEPVADPEEWGYLELVDTALTDTIGIVTRGGIDYTVTGEIRDFWRDDVNDTFISTDATDPPVAPAGATGGPAYAAFKLLKIDVAWNTNQEFYVDDANTAVLGSNNITLYEIIPSSPPILGAKIAADINEPAGGPIVEYNPGLVPDIIKLGLGLNGKFKESSSPMPDLIHSDESVETWFDVVTYNQAGVASFLRREEFLAVTCECELRIPDTGEGGLTPTVFNGYSYTEGKAVNKIFGEEAQAAQQSVFCDVCCRDHHDGAAATPLDPLDPLDPEVINNDPMSLGYGPSSGTVSQDHKHFGFSKKGDLLEAKADGDLYLEVCRLVRKDGFMRVVQDFSQDGFYGFPESYLETTDGAAAYGAFVVSAAEEFFESTDKSPTMRQPWDSPVYLIPASEELNATSLPTVPSAVKPISTEDQQLRARGVYLDYLTVEARANIDDCFDNDNSTGCIHPFLDPAVSTRAEMYPFFDVQLTWLSRWNEKDDLADPVDVTNEPVVTGNKHDRGRGFLAGRKFGKTDVKTTAHRGNQGLTATGPIIPKEATDPDPYKDYAVYIDALDEETPIPVDGFSIAGSLGSEVNSVKPSKFLLTPSDGVSCGQTDTEYACFISKDAVSPTLTISNYSAKFTLWGCSDMLSSVNDGVEAVFTLPPANTPDANIWIQKSSCP